FLEFEKRIGKQEFKKRVDRASIMAIADQNSAGIDFMSDGEEGRDHYVLYVLRRLGGIDFEYLKSRPMRGGVYIREVPVVVSKISYKGPFLVDDYLFTARYAKGIPKINLPGPSTAIDCLYDEYYKGDIEKMAMDYAGTIRHEVENLLESGCQIIQFDDPVLLRNLDHARKWGLKALQLCFSGHEKHALYIVHICRGYPHKSLEKKGIDYKAKTEYYSHILDWLSDSTIDILSIEGQKSNLDLSMLPAAGRKTVMLGIVDVGSDEVETVEQIVERGKEALNYLKKEQLILSPDCGMLQLSLSSAKKKLINIAEAASILNRA
ncbi:MAG: hypothetical protein JRI40_09750, partial [Deltaproteobacteria bacterium]|nr:hypothetical protein [Deltaproteobacteria bacterium]